MKKWQIYSKKSFESILENSVISKKKVSMVDELTIATVLLLVDHFRKYEACLGPILKHL